MPDNTRRRRSLPIIIAPVIQWLLRDDFLDAVAAGSVNGTMATPTGGARTVTDTNSVLSIGSGVASFATGGVPVVGDPRIYYPIIARVAGRTLVARIAGTNSNYQAGWETDLSASKAQSVNPFNTQLRIIVKNGAALVVGTSPASGVATDIALVMRASGTHYFIKEAAAFPNWTLLFSENTVTANAYPAIYARGATSVFNGDFIRVPQSLVTIAPLASDAFTRANAAVLGNTGGAGSEESGGSGLDWNARLGTWGIATNKAACAVLGGGLGIATVLCGSIDVMIEAVCTRTGGNAGIVARYADSDNYLIAYHDGTNAHLDKVVGGSTTSLINAAAAYSASARTILSLSGTGVRLYYNDALIGAQQTVSDAGLQTGTSHGIYTTDTGATFDSFVVWSKGNGGEYENLFNKYAV